MLEPQSVVAFPRSKFSPVRTNARQSGKIELGRIFKCGINSLSFSGLVKKMNLVTTYYLTYYLTVNNTHYITTITILLKTKGKKQNLSLRTLHLLSFHFVKFDRNR